MFKGLTAPVKIAKKKKKKTFHEVLPLLTNHENLKRNLLAERFKFNFQNHQNDESISHYMRELGGLSQYCKCRRICSDIDQFKL